MSAGIERQPDPLRFALSQAPRVMTTALQSSGRGCNQSSCDTTRAQGRVHLP